MISHGLYVSGKELYIFHGEYSDHRNINNHKDGNIPTILRI